METRPGIGDILVKLILDGDTPAYVIEENQDLRVKLPGGGRSGRRSCGVAPTVGLRW